MYSVVFKVYEVTSTENEILEKFGECMESFPMPYITNSRMPSLPQSKNIS